MGVLPKLNIENQVHFVTVNTIEKLNLLPENEWKDLNKQLKKVDDPEQIKAILKI